MKDLMTLFMVFSYVTLIISIVLIKAVKENYINVQGSHIFWCFICMTLSLFYLPSIMGYENTKIGSMYEGYSYSECYYVEVSNRSSLHDDRYIQKLPAQIYRNDGSYYMRNLYYSDGTVIPFKKSGDSINLEYSSQVWDDDGKPYNITLTKEKADKPSKWKNFKIEQNNVTAFDRILGFSYGIFFIFIYIKILLLLIKEYI